MNEQTETQTLEQQLKPKTLNYLNGRVESFEATLSTIIEYKQKLLSSTTNLSKNYYKKKISKLMKNAESDMKLFSYLQNITEQKKAQETSTTSGEA